MSNKLEKSRKRVSSKKEEKYKMDILIILDIIDLEDKNTFEKHIVKEGFTVVENERFVYTGTSTTSSFASKAYILEVFKKALEKTRFQSANMVFLLNEMPYPPYIYNKQTNEFDLKEEYLSE